MSLADLCKLKQAGILAICFCLLLTSCATFEPRPIEIEANPAEIHTKTVRDITVSATVLSDDLAEAAYGVALADVGLQAIWLRIDNRFVELMLAGDRHVDTYGFGISLPDGEFDFEKLQPKAIYAAVDLPELDREQLRQELRELPRCTSDKSGENMGDPLNLYLSVT